ncbi:MAG: signal peptidase II [Verrucomicrobia bacterium]|nr:signal peptidase II [Verrucomicrobiota bacterium]MDA1086092.1 signal peptidase II [Verrucomicrobiota bacterium]
MQVLLIAAVITFLDQFTKQWIRDYFGDIHGRSEPLIAGFLNLNYVGNTGAAWGIMQNSNGRLAVLSVVVVLVLVVFRNRILRDSRMHRIAFGLMVGGILGNLIDRVRIGHVIDFLDFHVGIHHFPSFNVADSGICVGVTIYIVSEWLHGRVLARSASATAQESTSEG